MSKKVAVIVGAGGQDGTILQELLTVQNYGIVAMGRNHVAYVDVKEGNKDISILNAREVSELIQEYTPQELYYLAAYHHSSEDILPTDREMYTGSKEVHMDGYLNFLEAISQYSPEARICYASSCLIYEGSNTHIQDEHTKPVPLSPYSITKLAGMQVGNWFQKKYGLNIVNAILYNHESEFRTPNFLSMKVIQGAIAISQGRQESITLGDISMQIDQGSAWDYVHAMILLARSGKIGDYIVSSGEQHTIQDMLEIVFGYLGLDWRHYIHIDPSIIQRKTGILFGDNTKIREKIGWNAKIGFQAMLESILEKQLLVSTP